jgi:hypothetical protein
MQNKKKRETLPFIPIINQETNRIPVQVARKELKK